MSSDADIEVDSTSTSDSQTKPGGLRGEVWLTLQTHQAQGLIRGRRAEESKPAILGLLGFADRLRTLWQAVRMDDPYADWWLLNVEEGIADSRERLRRLQQSLVTLMERTTGLEFAIAHSERPQRVSLQFLNPYAFRGAQLLADYDQVVCMEMTLRHVGVAIPTDLSDQLLGSGRWVRRVLALPQGYHNLAVSRLSMARGGPNVDKARERMGEVPDDIFRGDRLPTLRPVVLQEVIDDDPELSSEYSL